MAAKTEDDLHFNPPENPDASEHDEELRKWLVDNLEIMKEVLVDYRARIEALEP